MRSISVLILFSLAAFARGQTGFNTDTIGANSTTDNIYSRRIAGDSLSTSFCIVIKKEVKAHKHVFHSEQVMVIDGEGQMRLGEKNFPIKKGDVIFIPKNTLHAARSTGKIPLKVLSVQSPVFDGSDRIFVE
jgi:mannose-6-phosphate isomerase-like protein (cupin superfamily)